MTTYQVYRKEDGWNVEGDYEEFLNGDVNEFYFYRENVPSHAWDSDVAGYITKLG